MLENINGLPRSLQDLAMTVESLSWQEKLIFVAKSYQNVVFSTSFSIEDQIILDFIARNNLAVEIFTLDTGRLPKETYQVWQNSLEKYGLKIKAFYPNQDEIADFVEQSGINAFYDSVELRKKCCAIRKVEPLKRALKNKEIWISGVRKGQSVARSDKGFFEHDESFDLIKFYPLLDFSEEELWEYINKNEVPINSLYKKGFKSIGCQPCSRAISEGEDDRAGRWWWENDSKEKKECGLHG